jgi:hypothetical protein
MEHCIFDQVSLEVWKENSSTTSVSSFRKLYNQAIIDGKANKLITDDSVEIPLADLKVEFVPGTLVDPYDPSITYAQMQLNWAGFSAYYLELGYFSGTKSSSFDARQLGGALDLSLSALWKVSAADSADYCAPNTKTKPITFSTCVLITK